MAVRKKFGWRPDPHGVERVLNDPRIKHPVFGAGPGAILKSSYEQKDTYLWRYVLNCKPKYRRGAQGIGDCVSWGAELGGSTLYAKWCVKNGMQHKFKEVATEPIYGGSRVESQGKKRADWQDGSFGAAAAKWVNQNGVLLREDCSIVTEVDEHDLRKYSKQKAKNWGYWGCGGEHDGGKLDELSKEHPCSTVSQVNSFDDVAAAIAGAQCPVTIASMAGFGDMKRNQYGECNWTDEWAHQMLLWAVRFGGRPGALCAQSWGPNSASGPSGDDHCDNLPGGETPENILGFCWWIPAETVDRICRSGDCWAFGDIDGWEVDSFDWDEMWG